MSYTHNLPAGSLLTILHLSTPYTLKWSSYQKNGLNWLEQRTNGLLSVFARLCLLR